MDPHKLRSLVFEKTGARIDVDDPVFALVAMNEAVLEEALQRLAAASGGAALPPAATAAGAPSSLDWRSMGLAAASAVIGGLLVAWLARPPAASVAPAPAAALTAEQTAALERAAKLEKAIQKLDAKTRSALQAELQK